MNHPILFNPIHSTLQHLVRQTHVLSVSCPPTCRQSASIDGACNCAGATDESAEDSVEASRLVSNHFTALFERLDKSARVSLHLVFGAVRAASNRVNAWYYASCTANHFLTRLSACPSRFEVGSGTGGSTCDSLADADIFLHLQDGRQHGFQDPDHLQYETITGNRWGNGWGILNQTLYTAGRGFATAGRGLVRRSGPQIRGTHLVLPQSMRTFAGSHQKRASLVDYSTTGLYRYTTEHSRACIVSEHLHINTHPDLVPPVHITPRPRNSK
jgi:hypothetical protein